MNVNLKLCDLYSSLFVIRFSLIFQKKNWWWWGGGGVTEKSQAWVLGCWDITSKGDTVLPIEDIDF